MTVSKQRLKNRLGILSSADVTAIETAVLLQLAIRRQAARTARSLRVPPAPVAIPRKFTPKSASAVCPPAPAGTSPDSMTYLLTFGESGKNFIEIGKRLELRETMLRLAVP
jgi:hypothetical protein